MPLPPLVPQHPDSSGRRRRDLVPVLYDAQTHPEFDSQEMLQTLRWMMQKELVNQDMFLLGPPGPELRRLALYFCQILERECEVVVITRDTTEADLKQRAEVCSTRMHSSVSSLSRASGHRSRL